MDIQIITTFEGLQPHIKAYAPLIGMYHIWNFTSRQRYKPELFERNLTKMGKTLNDFLTPYEVMIETKQLTISYTERKKKSFEKGEWLALTYIGKDIAGTARLTHRSETEAELHSVFVTPQYRGQNLGFHTIRKLLSVGKDHGFDIVYLETMEFMDTAVRLYHQLGFSPEEYIEFGYPSREHAEEIGAIYMSYKIVNEE